MLKVILFIAILGLAAESEKIFAQTIHYHGLANIHDYIYTFPPECGPNGSSNSIDTIQYTLFHRNGLRDSISYVLSPHSFLGAGAIPNDTFYIKNDQDSIIFQFQFQDGSDGSDAMDFCQHYTTFDNWTGIARIATSTAGLLKEDPIPQLQLYPNPTNDFLNINSSIRKAIISDNFGRTIMTKIWNDDEDLRTLDVSGLTSGYYTIVLEGEKNRSIGKFIKY